MSDHDSESPIDAQMAAPPVAFDPAAPPNPAQAGSSDPASDLIQNRRVVLAVLFLVTGVLGIPLLWMNRNFSDIERIVWSIIVTIYTALLFYIAWSICMWSYRQIFGY